MSALPFAINGVYLDDIYLPKIKHNGATWSVQDIDSSETGRNSYGKMMRDRVAVKIKWQLTFPSMSGEMLSALLNALSEPSFLFTYPDPFNGGAETTKTCYVGDRAVPMYSIAENLPTWGEMSFSIIEM